MKKLTANDGTFWVSLIRTNDGRNIAFCYAWESAVDEVSEKIIKTYPKYFEIQGSNDVWLKPDADNTISLDELKKVISMDKTDSMVLLDFDTKEVIDGVKNFLDINSFKNAER